MSSINGRVHAPFAPLIRFAIRAGLAGAALSTSLAVNAQTQPSEEGALEEIVVTGFRESLEQSLNAKRASSAAVDTIFAEDIADFPDLNLAESIQRIPGVAIDRVGGEGQQISIRGLSPEFSRVRINGMEGLTTTSATDAVGTNRGRAFDFNVFASELFNRITVHKTSTAELDEGSLGATIELQTARPFDYDGLTFVTSYQQGYNDFSDKLDPRAVALFSTSNDSRTFGVLLSAAYSKRHTQEEGVQGGGWEANANSAVDRWANSASLPAEVNSAVHPRIPRYVSFEHEQERLGLTGALQWQPTDSTLLSLDVLYSKLDATRTEPFLEAISFARDNASGRGATVVRDYALDANNTMVYGLFDNVDVRSENRFDEWTTEFTQYSLNLSQEFGDRVHLDALVGTSKSELDVPVQTTIVLEAFDVDNYVYDFRGGRTKPQFSYGFDVTDPASWVVSEVRDRPSNQENTFDTGRADLTFEMTDALSLNTGISWKEYTFDVTEARRDATLPINRANCALGRLQMDPSLGHLSTFGENLDVPAGTQTSYFVADIDATAAALGFYTDSNCFPLVTRVQDVRSVEEEDTGAHVQVNFETEVFGLPFRGDVGVRYVETALTSTGVQATGPANAQILVPVTVEHEYTDTLPAANFVLEPVESFLVRLAYSKVMSRPNLGNLSPGGTINGFSSPPVVTFGNPELKPFRADAYDLSFEWYFAEEALLSLALFKKDIESFTVSTITQRPWSELGLPDSLLDQVPAEPTDIFDVRTTVNGEGGDLEGYEIQYQQPLTFLPGPEWLDDFGVIANYTHVSSEVNFGPHPATGIEVITDLNGQSREAYNFTLYYDNGRFDARVSASYRGKYNRNAISGRTRGNDTDFTKSSTYVDLSTSYEFNDNFKMSLEALNLTEEFRTDLMDTTAQRIDNYFGTGRQYYLGLQYSY
jgi:iron complex outermembrane receptor protein